MTNPMESPADVLMIVDTHRRNRPELSVAYADPVGPLEVVLAEIWSVVLQIDHIGREDNLFGLGGDSLSVVRIMSRIYHRLGVEVLLSECFENPTIGSLAVIVKGRIDPKVFQV